MSKSAQGGLHRLTPPQAIVHATGGLHFDGGGLLLRIDASRASWVFR